MSFEGLLWSARACYLIKEKNGEEPFYSRKTYGRESFRGRF